MDAVPPSWFDDLLYPATDAGVAVQVAVAAVATAAMLALVRRERALVLLAIGISMLVFGWFGLRALH